MRSIRDITARMGKPRSTGADPYAGGVMTRQGWFSFEELEEVGAKEVVDSKGDSLIQFPIRVSRTHGPQYRDIPVHVIDSHAQSRQTTYIDQEEHS